jgi:hypothetical protein
MPKKIIIKVMCTHFWLFSHIVFLHGTATGYKEKTNLSELLPHKADSSCKLQQITWCSKFGLQWKFGLRAGTEFHCDKHICGKHKLIPQSTWTVHDFLSSRHPVCIPTSIRLSFSDNVSDPVLYSALHCQYFHCV